MWPVPKCLMVQGGFCKKMGGHAAVLSPQAREEWGSLDGGTDGGLRAQ